MTGPEEEAGKRKEETEGRATKARQKAVFAAEDILVSVCVWVCVGDWDG